MANHPISYVWKISYNQPTTAVIEGKRDIAPFTQEDKLANLN